MRGRLGLIDANKVRSRVRVVRVVAYVALALLLAYGAWRYDIASLPDEGCSPLLVFEPGDTLVLDRHPGDPAEGAALLYRSPLGELLLGKVAAPPASAPADVWAACEAGALWIVGDRTSCPGEDSRLFGPITPSSVEAVVLFSLPW